MDSGADDAMAVDQIRFRPSTKRKAYRRRADEREEDNDDTQQQQNLATTSTAADDAPRASRDPEQTDDEEDAGSGSDAAVLTALRARQTRKGRLQGVGFRSGGHNGERASGPLVLANQEDEDAEGVNPLSSIAGRFTHQTGVINDVDDRHMYEESPFHMHKSAARKEANLLGTTT